MPERRDPRFAERLPDTVAASLLARASELDAVRNSSAAIADLRKAAMEAGISAEAFDAALTEMQNAEELAPAAATAHPRPRTRRWILAAALAAMLAFGTYGVRRSVPPVAVGGPMIEEVILLRCLGAGEAIELIRPILTLRTNTVVSSPRSPRVITILANTEQLKRVRTVLDQHDRTESSTCSSAPARAVSS